MTTRLPALPLPLLVQECSMFLPSLQRMPGTKAVETSCVLLVACHYLLLCPARATWPCRGGVYGFEELDRAREEEPNRNGCQCGW